MSNAVQFDPLLVRYLAAELNENLRGRGCAAAPTFHADRAVVLGLDRGEYLRLDLHPSRGLVRLLPSDPDPDFEPEAVVEEVSAPGDERLLILRLRDLARFASPRRTLVFELHTNQWNAILVGENERIVSVLRARAAGDRALFPGQPYVAPACTRRLGLDPVHRQEAFDAWAELGSLPPDERRSFLISRFAYTGAVNADWILGGAAGIGSEPGDGFDLRASFDRWWWIRGLPEVRPAVLRIGGRLQPYPIELAGMVAVRVKTLLEAMDHVASAAEAPARDARPRVDPAEEAGRYVSGRIRALRRRLARLRKELADQDRAASLRHQADLLLANLREIRKGDSEASIEDWDGQRVTIPLDPLLTPAENAARLYEQARRRERAAARIPGMVAAAEAELERWREAAQSIERGEVPAWVEEQLRTRTEAAAGSASSRRSGGAERGPSLPYRVFRTSGGLEVRVGKGAKENDRLTFRESAPNDVWLHARSVPGSHVVLRWPRADESPPARDLLEAAQLAAVFSRARTSSTVAVDWTRRKHVRKPRGAAPGLVIPERVKTLFVEPDESVVERLAASTAPPGGERESG